MNSTNNKEINFQEEVIRSASHTKSDVRFIQDRKQLAMARLKNIKFPSRKDEAWKYYDFSDILDFDLSQKANTKLNKAELVKLVDKYVFRETVSNLLVTVDGSYSQELSNFNFNSNELRILNFNNPEELQADSEVKSIVEKLFARNIESEEKYFKAINTILMQSGFLLYIKDGYTNELPLQILHISTKDSLNQIRSLIYAGKNSNIKLMVSYVGLEGSKYFTNAVIECFLEQGSKLKLEKIQNESHQATRLYSFNACLQKDSNFEYNSYSFGAKSNREDINIDLLESGAEASVNGLYVLGDKRKSHHKVCIQHLAPHTTSNQLYKGILQGASHAEFNGLIEVAREAQQTNAEQLNKNLLLSKEAVIDSRPQLNILADDVKCSHGSTVGSLNDEELFYLQSRGLSEEAAQIVLTYSFCQELIEKISLESARNYTRNLAYLSLSKSDNEDIVAQLADNAKFKKERYQA